MLEALVSFLRRGRASGLDMLVPRRAPPGPPKIDVSRVGHGFGVGPKRVVALRDVNISVHHGEFVCLLGPSGCGKSTLLYALAGHLDPTGGSGPAAVVAGAVSGGVVLVVRPEIRNPSDLVGRRMASPQLGNSQDVALRTWLHGQGLSERTSRSVEVTPIANADMAGLLSRGDLAGPGSPSPGDPFSARACRAGSWWTSARSGREDGSRPRCSWSRRAPSGSGEDR